AADEPYRQSADAGQEPATQLTPRTLVWTPPLTREDGSSLAPGQISEYRIYSRPKHKESYDVIALKDAGTTSFVLDSMPPGGYDCSVTTVDVEGLESRRSDPVQINLIGVAVQEKPVYQRNITQLGINRSDAVSGTQPPPSAGTR